MALIYKQTVVQEATGDTPKRRIIQYYDDVALEDKQVIENFADLTTQEQTECVAAQLVDESKMV